MDGVRIPNADPQKIDRIASLRFLEYNTRQPDIRSWRSGNAMRKVVAQRKVLVYAILRGLPDPRGEQAIVTSPVILVGFSRHHTDVNCQC